LDPKSFTSAQSVVNPTAYRGDVKYFGVKTGQHILKYIFSFFLWSCIFKGSTRPYRPHVPHRGTCTDEAKRQITSQSTAGNKYVLITYLTNWSTPPPRGRGLGGFTISQPTLPAPSSCHSQFFGLRAFCVGHAPHRSAGARASIPILCFHRIPGTGTAVVPTTEKEAASATIQRLEGRRPLIPNPTQFCKPPLYV